MRSSTVKQAVQQRFRVHHLDCANCAAKIEKAIQALEGIDEAVLDFARLTLQVQGRDMARLLETVRRIEPGVELVPESERGGPTADRDTPAQRPVGKLVLLAGAALLFVVQLLLEKTWPSAAGRWLMLAAALAAYLLAGWNVLANAYRTVRRGDLFDENVLMVIATGGAFAIQAMSEAVAVMLFYKLGELLQELAVSRSRRSISALLATRPQIAHVQAPGGFRTVSPEEVSVGEILMVKPGEKIPLDGMVLSGTGMVDNSPLTGEPRPVKIAPGDTVMAGAINTAAAITLRVDKPFAETSIARIIDLVQHATARKAGTEKFITTFARYYTPAVVLAAAGIALIPPLVVAGALFKTWIYRALVLLVISCPCALVVSIPMGYFGGIGRASRRGILVKGSQFIDALAKVRTVVFDKTGTLTQGRFEVQEVVPHNGYTQDQVLNHAALAEFHSSHPIARSIVKAHEAQGGHLDPAAVAQHTVIAGRGVRAVVNGRVVSVGNDLMLHQDQIDHQQCRFEGTVAHVTIAGTYAGYILIGDRLKPEAHRAVDWLRRSGVEQLIMLTGDNACAAEQVGRRLGLDQFHADLLPEQKVARFEAVLAEADGHGKVAFVGDGINDAPAIARADVGIAMGALGSDAAIETADVVLMTDSVEKIPEAVDIARQTRRIVWQNILMALIVKGVFVGFGAFGMATMWEAVFADMGTAVLAVLNATRALGLHRRLD
jgi:Cd2+/Zn2+-exporting ATPase